MSYRSNTSDPFGSKTPKTHDLAQQMLTKQTASKNAMVRKSEAGWELRRVWLDKVGAHFPDDLSMDDFNFVGSAIFSLKERVNLWIGDWLVASERVYGQTYQQMSAQTGLAVETLYNYHRVCSKVEISLRSEKLGYSHYALIAAMPPEEQADWIAKATADKNNIWSVEFLRLQIQDARGKSPTLPDRAKVFTNENKRRITAIIGALEQGRAIKKADLDLIRDLAKLAKAAWDKLG